MFQDKSLESKAKFRKVILFSSTDNHITEPKIFVQELSKALERNGFSVKDLKDSACELGFYLNDRVSSPIYIYSSSQTFKQIYTSLSCNINGKKGVIWEGFTEGRSKPYYKYQQRLIDNLVALIGVDYKGYLKISEHDKERIDRIQNSAK